MSTVYSRRLVFAAACLGMLVFGIMLTTLGAILPSVIERFGIDKANAGSLFFLMSLGILVSSIVFGPIVDRYGYKSVLLVCSALILVGLEGIAFAPSLGWLRGAVLLIGLAGGVVNGGANALVADISEAGRSAGLSLLGVFFGVGAVGVPFTLGLLLDTFSYGSLIAVVGLTLLLPIVFTAAIRFPAPKQAQGFPIREGARLAGDPALLLMGFILFLQSGMEITVGGWTATYFHEVLGLEGSRALLCLSLYWLGMMLARLVLGSALRRVSPARVLRLSIGCAFLGAVLLIASRSPLPAAVGVFLLGTGFAAGFPVVLGYVGDRYAALSGTAFSITLAIGLSGGMILPYLTGALGEGFGMRASFLVVPAALGAQTILFALALRRSATAPAAVLTPPGGVDVAAGNH